MRPAPATASPLVPVLAFAGLSSFAAGSGTLSIFFVTASEPYSFTDVQQYALGLLVGVTYTLAALSAARVRRALRLRGVGERALIAVLALAMAGVLLGACRARSDAGLIALLGLYAPLTGLFWPVVEAYVSGGRTQAGLRAAAGRFNIVWSATLLLSFLVVPSLVERSPSAVFLVIAATHAASVLLLPGLRREPGAHPEDAHVAPPRTHELLRVHRVLHALSYLVMYALSPYLPTVLERIGFTGGAAGLLASTWLASRVVGFAVLERWHGWHGRWWVAVAGFLAVLGGFGAVVLADSFGTSALAVCAGGMLVFGAGLAALYNAALYYSFECGGDEGGGSHEALIGIGYSVGPACGLAVFALVRAGALDPGRRDAALLAVIALVCLGAAWLAWRGRSPASPGA